MRNRLRTALYVHIAHNASLDCWKNQAETITNATPILIKADGIFNSSAVD
jgi:hypothetical protein